MGVIIMMMCVVVAVCNYQRYGRGGGQETKGALCILSLNMINDKARPDIMHAGNTQYQQRSR